MFLGYPNGKKGWRVLNLETKKVFYSRDVVFLESEFPYAEKLSSTHASMEPVLQQNSDHVCLDDEFQDRPLSEILDRAEPTGAAEPLCEVFSPAVPSSNAENEISSSENATDTSNSENGRVDTDNTPLQVSDNSETVEENTEAHGVSSDLTSQPAQPPQQMEVVQLGRGQRQKKIPPKLHDYILSTVRMDPDPTSGRYSISTYVDYSVFSVSHCKFLAAITTAYEPRIFKEAMEDENWHFASRAQIDALEESGTWDVVKLPKGKKAPSCK